MYLLLIEHHQINTNLITIQQKETIIRTLGRRDILVHTEPTAFAKKSMKKSMLLILVVITLIPSSALATWWNPFSWNVQRVIPEEAQSTRLQQIEKPNVTEKSAAIEERIIERPTTVDLSGIYKRLDAIERRLLALENRSPSVIVRETVSTSDDLTDELSDLKDAIESLASRFDDHQSCMRRWSIGNEFMLGDDVYHCSNK